MREISTLLLAALLLSATCRAGPVSTEAVQPAEAEAPVLLRPAAPGTARSEASAASSPTQGGASDAPGAASTELAADILREAGVSAAASGAEGTAAQRKSGEATPANGRANPPTAAAAKPAPPEDEAWRELREFGKASVNWVKEMIPWLRRDAEDEATQNVSADWSDPSHSGGAASRRGAAGVLPHQDATAHAAAAQSAAADRYLRMEPEGTGSDLIRTFLGYLRVVLEHPMTWLVVSLFVVGGYVMSKADRRPK